MTRLIVLSIFSLFAFCTCTWEDSIKPIIFSGKIINPNSDTIGIFNSDYVLVATIQLRKDHSFSDSLYLPNGYYKFNDGRVNSNIYLNHGFNLTLTVNSEEYDESIHFTGLGAKENNYLIQKTLLEKSFGNRLYYGYYGKLNETDFLSLMDSLYDLKLGLLQNAGLDANFYNIESNSLKFDRLKMISEYQGMHQYLTGKQNFHVSDKFPRPYTEINMDNENLLLSPTYIPYIQGYLREKSFKKSISDSLSHDYSLAYIHTLQDEVKNKKIQEKLMYLAGKSSLNNTKYLDSAYSEIKPYLTNKNYLSEIEKIYSNLKKIEKGAASPEFTFTDINNREVSLRDLKGKLVYIDIWATWCLPCIKEIPSLKQLEDHFNNQNIAFISICTSSKRDNWETMVKEQKLGGIQLYAPNENASFFKEYLVLGFPRFILIDHEGKIIDSNAKRPSDPNLKAEISAYL